MADQQIDFTQTGQRTPDEMSIIRSAYRNVLGREIDPSGYNTWSNSNMALDDILNEIANSPEAVTRAKSTAAQLYDPQLTDLESQQGAIQANTNAAIGNVKDLLQENKQTLQDNQAKQELGLTQKQQNLGLLRSGGTSAGLEDIAKTTTKNLASVEKEANLKIMQYQSELNQNLAKIALQRAGLTQSKLQKEMQIRDQATNTVSGIINQVQSNKKAQLDQGMALTKLALTIPKGQVVDIPGYGQIVGLKESTSKSSGSGSSDNSVNEDLMASVEQYLVDPTYISKIPTKLRNQVLTMAKQLKSDPSYIKSQVEQGRAEGQDVITIRDYLTSIGFDPNIVDQYIQAQPLNTGKSLEGLNFVNPNPTISNTNQTKQGNVFANIGNWYTKTYTPAVQKLFGWAAKKPSQR